MSSVSYFVASDGDKDFVVTFEYLEEGHLFAYLNGVLETDWTIVDPSTLRFGAAVTTTAGDIVRIARSTPIDSPEVSFQSVTSIRKRELKRSNDQLLFKLQELNLDTFVGLSKNLALSAWDAQNLRIEDVGTPVQGADAANKTYVDNEITTAISGGGSGGGTGLPDPGVNDGGRAVRLVGGTPGVTPPTYAIAGLAVGEANFKLDYTGEPIPGITGMLIESTNNVPGAYTFPANSAMAVELDTFVLRPVNGFVVVQSDGKTITIPQGKFEVDAWATVTTGGSNTGTSTSPHFCALGLRKSDNTLYYETRKTYVGYGPQGVGSFAAKGSVTLHGSCQIDASAGATDLQLRLADAGSGPGSAIYCLEAYVRVREVIE